MKKQSRNLFPHSHRLHRHRRALRTCTLSRVPGADRENRCDRTLFLPCEEDSMHPRSLHCRSCSGSDPGSVRFHSDARSPPQSCGTCSAPNLLSSHGARRTSEAIFHTNTLSNVSFDTTMEKSSAALSEEILCLWPCRVLTH